MKKVLIAIAGSCVLFSCNKVEEKINETVTKTTESVTRRATEAGEKIVRETVTESINSVLGSEDVPLSQVFKNTDNINVSELKGKKIKFPNGSQAFVFKYKAPKSSVLPFFETQPTTDESKSEKTARKIDGQSIIDKISFLEKFVPADVIDPKFLDDLKNDKSIEYYKIKRFPNTSTIIINPKDNTVLQYVEVEK
jgi:hypothetical protein